MRTQSLSWFAPMPVIKVFTADPVSASLAEAMGHDMEQLCLGLLRAHPSAIQIAFLPAVMARGAPALLEMHYRAQPFRDATALAGFMDGAERSLQEHLGQVPRIRCFAVDAVGLSARN
ncbi:hypothetical protein [Hydrogenophaga palleronii]|uniref:hypothetical protein n=1 Tax=Hydrogenophaga palleronii TaxID=65655 RepID=UPI0008266E64|nr:hypothetical protein [Hydrogenophaga palleronii]